MTGHTREVTAVGTAVLSDGRVVAVTGGWDRTVRVWDLATATPIGDPLVGHTNTVTAVVTAVLPDGRVVAVTGSHDHTMRIWDLAAGTALGDPMNCYPHWVAVVVTTMLPDGRLVAVTGGNDATVRIWDLSTGTQIGEPFILPQAVTALDVRGSEIIVCFGREIAVMTFDSDPRDTPGHTFGLGRA